jgi:1,2-dihydroxy-3-keto-5-methylthiopentene dioxygenase
VLYWRLNPANYENDEELKKIREDRGYNYMVCLISYRLVTFVKWLIMLCKQ